MIPKAFDYCRPKTLPEAISLLQQHGDAAKILSGGQSLIPMMKMRLAQPEYLIDINQISGLDYIKEEEGYLKIGALTREADLEASDLIRSKYPLILDTAFSIADPPNDHPATMLALNAEVIATGPDGQRSIPIKDFFVSLFTTALQPNEILSEIRNPIPPTRSGGAYFKLERKVGDFATVGVAAQVTIDAKGTCQRAGIGLTNVGGTPIEATKAEEFLRGKALDDGNISQAASLAADDAHPSSDLRGPAEYKISMVRELTKSALTKALNRASQAH